MRGQVQLGTLAIGGFILSLLGFVGGGAFLSRGQVEIREDIIALETESRDFKEDIKALKEDMRFVRETIAAMAARQGIKIEKR